MQLKHTHKKMCAMYREGAVTDLMCHEYLRSFMLETSCWMILHSPQLGRRVEVDSEQKETLIENDQYCTMQERANILKNPNE